MTQPAWVGTGRRRRAAALLAALAVSGCGTGGAPSTVDASEPTFAVPGDVAGCDSFAADGEAVRGEDALPVLTLPCMIPGQDVTLDDLGDGPVLVNLWASWCAPCREEMPMLQRAYEREGGRIGFLGVVTEDAPSAPAFLLGDLDVTYAHVVDRDKELLTELAAPGLAVTLADGPPADRLRTDTLLTAGRPVERRWLAGGRRLVGGLVTGVLLAASDGGSGGPLRAALVLGDGAPGAFPRWSVTRTSSSNGSGS